MPRKAIHLAVFVTQRYLESRYPRTPISDIFVESPMRLNSLHRDSSISEGVRISNSQFDFDFENDAEDDLVTVTDVDTYPVSIVTINKDKRDENGKLVGPVKETHVVHCIFKYNAYRSQRITQEMPRERNRTVKTIDEIDKVYSDISRYNIQASTTVVKSKVNSTASQLNQLADSFSSKMTQAAELTRKAATGLTNGELQPNFIHDLRSMTSTSVYNKNTDEAAKSTWKSKCNAFLNGVRKTFGGTMRVDAKDKGLIGSLFQGDVISKNAKPKMPIIQLINLAAEKFVNKAGKNYSAILIPASSGKFNEQLAVAIQSRIGSIPIIECPKNKSMSTNDGGNGGVYFDRAAYQADCKKAGKEADQDPFQGGRGAGGAQWGYNLSGYTSPPKRIKDINQEMRKYWKNLYVINDDDMMKVAKGDILIIDDSLDSDTTMRNCFEMLQGYDVRSATGCVLLNLKSSATAEASAESTAAE